MKAIASTALVLSGLFLAACGGSQVTAPNGASATGIAPTAAPPTQTVTFHESEFKIDPATLSLKAGTYQFVYINDGKFGHDLHVTGQGSAAEVAGSTSTIKTGQMASFTITLKPGIYTYFCAVPGHKDAGMVGTLTVT